MNTNIFNVELLESYSKEIGVSTTLQELIDSHRSLRNENARRTKMSLAEMEAYRANAKRIAEEGVLNGEYISIEKLRTMTIRDIADLVGE
jgi:hypothetical protein